MESGRYVYWRGPGRWDSARDDVKPLFVCLPLLAPVQANIMSRSLLQFLKEARNLHLRFISGALVPSTKDAPIYVVGNPSADLDSILSAILYSYFAHLRTPSSSPRSHIPLLNLPTIPSGPELCRLRPEFAKALWLCTNNPAATEAEKWEDTPESAGKILSDHIITVNDFANHLREHGKSDQKLHADATLVDWNALPIRIRRGEGCLTGLVNVTFSVVGYIDHHVDEKFVPPPKTMQNNQPAIIHPAGSCASLVVSWLHRQGLWSIDEADTAIRAQLASLALSPILIDTANLTAKSKVTETDVEAVAFAPLMDWASSQETPSSSELYSQIQETKQSSLDLLTVPEILDRDFKSWTETSQTGETLRIGFCSVVKSIPWVLQKASNTQAFLDSLHSFSNERKLDIVVVMTAFSSKDQKFCRELFVCALRDGMAVNVLESFVPRASGELGLKNWATLDRDMVQTDEENIRSALSSDAENWRRLWIQSDVSKSRKQVAPLLRNAVARL